MQNKFLKQADKEWERNGMYIEEAVLMLAAINRGVEFTPQEVMEVSNALLKTLMTDTPSGMFQSTIESIIKQGAI